MQTKKKLQKPIDQDIHLKYRCQKCSQEHWLSYKEASTIQFKIVCDCGEVFRVKRVIGFELKFKNQKSKQNKPTADNAVKEPEKTPIDLLEKSVILLVGYGFTKKESIDLINASYTKNPVNDFALLVKQTLENIRN
jgi:DNA-directed RNA polymerase subunit RPC12/RpoP